MVNVRCSIIEYLVFRTLCRLLSTRQFFAPRRLHLSSFICNTHFCFSETKSQKDQRSSTLCHSCEVESMVPGKKVKSRVELLFGPTLHFRPARNWALENHEWLQEFFWVLLIEIIIYCHNQTAPMAQCEKQIRSHSRRSQLTTG
jgi:hypothetical protein